MQYTILFCYDHFYFSFSWLKEMEEHMRSMLHHRELENLKGRYENNLESVLLVQFVLYSGRTHVRFPIQAELHSLFYVSLICMVYDKAGNHHIL